MLLSLFLSLWGQWQQSQNPILFGGEGIAETRLARESVTEQCALWRDFLNQTRIAPGVFERRPGYGDINSHDNYQGMALGGWACDFPDIAIEIVNELSRTGWMFNDVQPGVFDIRGQLTPKDIVPLKLVAGWEPALWETVYASADLCIGRSWNLKRSRLLIYEHYQLPWLHSLILSPCVYRAKRMVNYVEAGCNYHGAQSPQCVALKKNEGVWK